MACVLGTDRTSFQSTNVKLAQIDVHIQELVFTPLACASLVNEVIKSLVYQKSQIPYPYNWLKTVVNRKRKNAESENVRQPLNLTLDKCYRLASNAYDNLEQIMRSIRMEFEAGSDVREVLILFGTTAYCPKEAFTIKIPKIARGHTEDNHLQAITRNQHKILRHIFLSDAWMAALDKKVSFTNMHVMLKKGCSRENAESHNHFFLLNSSFSFPSRVETIVINLNYETDYKENCCSNLVIFEDKPGECTRNTVSNTDSNISVEDFQWYQAKVLLTGFKDCFVNKTSASELW